MMQPRRALLCIFFLPAVAGLRLVPPHGLHVVAVHPRSALASLRLSAAPPRGAPLGDGDAMEAGWDRLRGRPLRRSLALWKFFSVATWKGRAAWSRSYAN